MARYASLFPPYYNPVREDSNYFLLHTWYYRDIDKLFILYIKYDTGETVLDIIDEPQVPIFIAKQKPERNLEFIERSLTNRFMVPYKDKSHEVKNYLFQPKVSRYKDKYGFKRERVTFPDVPKRAELLHPSLFNFDIPIEKQIYMEYAMNRYEKQGDISFENVRIPNIHYGAFDIETQYHEDGDYWSIYTNTYVDAKDNVAYLDYVRDYDTFPRQEYLTNHKDEFIAELRQVLADRIDNLELSKKNKAKVQEICRNITEKLEFRIREFPDEATLIKETTRTMFVKHRPNILMAYNTTYDVGMFEDRILALGLPKGTMNESGIGFDEIDPPFQMDGNRDEFGKFRGDAPSPVKRRVYLNNISHTLISDLETVFFSTRPGQIFSSFKLDDTGKTTIGFGKHDFSHLTNSILKLPKVDFWVASQYALIDSILLILINAVTGDFDGKLAYCMRTKCNIEETPSSNSAITSCFHTDIYVDGYVIGNNINKVIRSMDFDTVKKCSDAIGIDFMKNKIALLNRGSFGGGLVADPTKYVLDKDLFNMYHVLSDEAKLTTFLILQNLVYLDFKSHYPITTITRNLSRGTLVGRITKIIDNKTNTNIYATEKTKEQAEYIKPHLGQITLAIANQDVISYASKVNGVPTIGDLSKMIVEFDSEPITSPKTYKNTSFHVTKDFIGFCSFLSHLNKSVISKTDEGIIKKDNGMFLLHSGELMYQGDRIEYIYHDNDIMCPPVTEHVIYKDPNEIYYASVKVKEKLINTDNGNRNVPKNSPLIFTTEYKEFPKDILHRISQMILFADIVELDGYLIRSIDKSWYFPWEDWLKQTEWEELQKDPNVKHRKWPKGKPKIENICYRIQPMKVAPYFEFKYDVVLYDNKTGDKLIGLTIIQQRQFVKLSKEKFKDYI